MNVWDDPDPYFKKTVLLRHAGRRLTFATSQALFSSQEIDIGTRMLLRSIEEHPPPGPHRRAFDLGCGYGPLGIALRASGYESAVLVDRDALAAEYADRNAKVNALPVEVHGELGLREFTGSGRISGGCDLVVSNIPAKAGPNAIRAFVLGVSDLLDDGGVAAIVVVDRLAESVSSMLVDTPAVELAHRRSSAAYTVFHYGFSGVRPPPIRTDGLDVYIRKRVAIRLHGERFHIQPVYSIDEFGTPSYSTETAARVLSLLARRPRRRVTVWNPGQGHLPIWLNRRFAPEVLQLADRDLLALEISRLNVVEDDAPSTEPSVVHTARPSANLMDGPSDLVVCVLRAKEERAVNAALVTSLSSTLSSNGVLVVAGSSTAVTRVLNDSAHGRTMERVKYRGHAAVALAHR